MVSKGKPGIDFLGKRPTPAVETMKTKLQKRKLDALKRGIHRINDTKTLPYGVHLIGLGGAGAHIVEQVLREAPDDLLEVAGSRLSALAIDIGDQDMGEILSLASKFSTERAQIETVALAMPTSEELFDALQRYPDFLKLEYPRNHLNTNFRPWLSADCVLPKEGEHVPRAVAKAIYGRAYYSGERPLAAALRRFAKSVDATAGDSVVCIVFGLGGGTGSGIAVDLARHLSNGIFGHRVLVTGIGIAPCDGDPQAHVGGHLFPVLSELDCLCDEEKNRGVVMPCGDLYVNPFTAGFIIVPQQHIWERTRNLAEAHARVDQEIASLLTLRRGANLREMLHLLNWVAAPSTQHSAARTPWGSRWIHMLGFADTADHPIAAEPDLPKQLGLLAGYTPEFIEMRVANLDDKSTTALASSLEKLFAVEVPPNVVGGGREGSVQFILPSIRKTDLAFFLGARDAYDADQPDEKLLSHSLLLDQGVLLCEPSTRLEGMAGAGLSGSTSWVAVPLAGLRGDNEAPTNTA